MVGICCSGVVRKEGRREIWCGGGGRGRRARGRVKAYYGSGGMEEEEEVTGKENEEERIFFPKCLSRTYFTCITHIMPC